MAQHYYSEKQESPLNLKKMRAVLRGVNLELFTASGIFSAKRVDNGAALLANESLIKDSWKILDLGCGYGPVGIAVAKAFPNSKVVLSDINERAVMIARKNIKLNRAVNASAVHGDCYEKAGGPFDAILLNPPQTAGKDICFRMIQEAACHLSDSGILEVVARQSKGGSSLSKKMKEVFGNVEVIARQSGYRIYLSRKSSADCAKN